MSTQPDDVGPRLARLLALKRHEVPPPYFFEQLPRRVLASIRAGAQIDDSGWLERLWRLLSREPVVAGSYAALGVGALLFGVSVFQMALDPVAPAPVALDGMMLSSESPSVIVPVSHQLPGGIIYRVEPQSYLLLETFPDGTTRDISSLRLENGQFFGTPVSHHR